MKTNSWYGATFWQRKTSALLTLIALAVFSVALVLSVPQAASASTELITNGDFGSGGDLDDIPDWEEKGDEDDDSTIAKDPTSGNESASPNGGRFARIGWLSEGNDGYICQEVDASSYENLSLSYYWRGDNDAEDSGGAQDYGHVEYLLDGSCDTSDGGWTNLETYDDIENEGWVSDSVDLSSLDGESFFLRFRAEVTSGSEHWRIDGVSVLGDEVEDEEGSIVIQKLIDEDGNPETTDDQTEAVSGWKFYVDFDEEGEEGPFETNGSGETEVIELKEDEFDVYEDVPEGYVLIDAWCTGADDDDGFFDGDGVYGVEADDEDEVVCTFVNAEIQPDSSLRVCKLILDDEGNVIDGSGLDTDFTIPLTGPDFDVDVLFETALSLNTNLVDDNGSDNDAQCVLYEGLEAGEYIYGEEVLGDEELWDVPMYHDYFDETPVSTSDFYLLTEDGSENDEDNADGVINLGESDSRTLAIVNTLIPEPEYCTVTIYSDTTNTVVEKDGAFAEVLSFIHSAWTAVIPGATWIWGDDPVAPPVNGVVQTFENSFDWNGPVVSATLYVAADNSYVATLNDSPAGADAGEFNYNLAGQDEHDVSSLIETGTNELSIEVTNKPGNSNPAKNPAGLLYKLEVVGTDENCDTPPEPEDPWCSYEGEVIDYSDPAYKNGGAPVDSNRRDVSAVENGPATYQNVGGKEPSWSTDDFFSLGIEGWLVYEFAGIAIDQPGSDIAVYEITGGSSGQTNEKVLVEVSANGSTWYSLGTITGDAELDISSTGLGAIKFVRLTDQSVGIQGPNGDGFDVDAIVILEGACGETPECVLDHELLTNGGFEDVAVTSGSNWDIFPSGYPGLGWVVAWLTSDGDAPVIANLELQKDGLFSGGASEGSQWTELDSDWNGHLPGPNGEEGAVAISQTVFTEMGETYTLSFDFSPRPNTGASQNKVEVLANGVSQGFVGPLAGGSSTSWTSHEFSFVADSILTTVMLRDAGTPNDSLGTLIDNASLMCTEPKNTYSTVTMCKYDHNEELLPGWTLMLLGDHVDSFAVDAADVNGVDSTALTGGSPYVALASGVWLNDRNPDNHVDAEYSTEDEWDTHMDGFTGFGVGILELEIAETDGDWGPYNSLHEYAQGFTPASDGPVNFRIFDGNTNTHTVNPSWYGDNKGDLDVEIYEGYVGVTDESGCVVFEGVPYGEYTASELEKEGWVVVEEPTNPVQVDTESMQLSFMNAPLTPITVEKWHDENQDGIWDEGESGILGWDIVVKPEALTPTEVLTVDSSDEVGEDSSTLTDGRVYLVEASGTYQYASNANKVADAGFYSTNNWSSYGEWGTDNPSEDQRTLNLVVDDEEINWGTYDGSHLYKAVIAGEDESVNFRVYERKSSHYNDNSGDITVRIYDVTDYVVSTDENGSAVVEVEPGQYQVVEIEREGWVQTAPTAPSYCHFDTEEGGDFVCSFGNYETETAPDLVNITAHKIICTDESELPNWGTGGPNITADTAQDWVDEYDSCSFAEDWEFEWGPSNAFDPGDTLTGYAGGAWTTFGPTDSLGSATVQIDVTEEPSHLWFREVLKEGYIPFTHDQNGNSNTDDVSAEFYCSTDVLNYDNYDRIDNPLADETYYCVGWNSPLPGAPTLTVQKETLEYDGEFDFEVVGVEFDDAFSIQTEQGVGSTQIQLGEGTFTVTEILGEDWELLSVSCELEDEPFGNSSQNGYEITVQDGNDVICTFVNQVDCEEGEHYDSKSQQCEDNGGDAYADLSIEKTVDEDEPEEGDEITYTITVENNGPNSSGAIVVSDLLPDGVTYVSHVASAGSYDENTGEWDGFTLGDEGIATLTITVTVNEDTEGDEIVNSASVSSTSVDENSGNDSDAVSIVVDDEDDNGDNGNGGNGGSPEEGPEIEPLGNGSPSLFGLGGGGLVLGATTGGGVLGETCGLYMDQYLRRGYTGNNPDQVTKLQEFLNKHGFGIVPVTGLFGLPTENAVKDFQNAYRNEILIPWGIQEPTGLVYLTTLRQINLIECPDLLLQVPSLVPWSLGGQSSVGTTGETNGGTETPSNEEEDTTVGTEEDENDQQASVGGAVLDEEEPRRGFWRGLWNRIFGR